MSKNINNKKVIKKVDDNNDSSDTESDFVDSADSDDGFDDLNISKKDLELMNLKTKDCHDYYYNKKDKCVYGKSMKTKKWIKPNESLQEQLLEMYEDKPKKETKKKVTKINKVVVNKSESDSESDDESDDESNDESSKGEQSVINKSRLQKKENITKKKLPKDEMYKKDQDLLFQRTKELIKLTPENTFLSNTIAENNEKITGELLEEMKKYFHSKTWNRLNKSNTRSSLAVLKKLFKYYNYEIISKEYTKGTNRGYKYYVVPMGKD